LASLGIGSIRKVFNPVQKCSKTVVFRVKMGEQAMEKAEKCTMMFKRA
jgi:N-glycosylase/DNA lyase